MTFNYASFSDLFSVYLYASVELIIVCSLCDAISKYLPIMTISINFRWRKKLPRAYIGDCPEISCDKEEVIGFHFNWSTRRAMFLSHDAPFAKKKTQAFDIFLCYAIKSRRTSRIMPHRSIFRVRFILIFQIVRKSHKRINAQIDDIAEDNLKCIPLIHVTFEVMKYDNGQFKASRTTRY